MSRQHINIGTVANDGTGDTVRTAFTKVNSNFSELYLETGTGQASSLIFGWPITPASIGTFPTAVGYLDGSPIYSDFVYATVTQPTNQTFRRGFHFTDVTDTYGQVLQVAEDSGFTKILVDYRVGTPARLITRAKFEYDTVYYLRIVGRGSYTRQFRFPLTVRTPALQTTITGFNSGVRPGVYVPTNQHVYCANQTANTVQIVNPATNTIAVTVTGVTTTPNDPCYAPTVDKIFFPCQGSSNVRTIAQSTNTLVDNITVGSTPVGCCYVPSVDRVYVANNGAAGAGTTVSVINPATASVVTTITVGTGPRLNQSAYCPTSDRLFVTNQTSDNVSVINPNTNTVVATVTVGDTPVYCCYHPPTDRVWVANNVAGTISIIDPATNVVTNTLTTLAAINFICWMPTTNQIWVSDGTNNQVRVIDPVTLATVTTISTGAATGPRVSPYVPNVDRMWVACATSNTMQVYQ